MIGWDSLTGFATSTWTDITGLGGKLRNVATGIWRTIRQAALGTEYVLTHPVEDLFNAVAGAAALVTGNLEAARNALHRLEGQYPNKGLAALRAWVQQQVRILKADILFLGEMTRRWVNARIGEESRWVKMLMAAERARRRLGDRRAEAYTRRHVRWALSLIQREAASAYRLSQPGQLRTLHGLADAIVTRDPALRAMVGRIVSGAVDLAEIDDPALRIALAFVLREVINRLGIDKAMGGLLDGLMTSVTGQAHPTNLHGVIEAITQRLDAVEQQWAKFMADGGPQLLQAGEEWRDLTSLPVDAALAVLFGGMVADPGGWARDISDVLSGVVGGAVDGISAVMREWG